MGTLDGRVAIVTGAGRGLGREHALLLAREGAAVVVNDLGSAPDGAGADTSAAQAVVAEIEAAGGRAAANTDDVSDFAGARRLVEQAVDGFGALHVLVNNAGILRDRSLANMSEEEWDAVVRVHLRGHAAPLRFASAYWRARSKAGEELRPALVNTTSVSGLIGQYGQSNYGAAKAGIAALTIIAQLELGSYGVRCNAVAPYARTRLTASPKTEASAREPFDRLHPGNVSPLVAFLAGPDHDFRGKVFFAVGGEVHIFQPWTIVDAVRNEGRRWEVAELGEAMRAAFAQYDFPVVMPA